MYEEMKIDSHCPLIIYAFLPIVNSLYVNHVGSYLMWFLGYGANRSQEVWLYFHGDYD